MSTPAERGNIPLKEQKLKGQWPLKDAPYGDKNFLIENPNLAKQLEQLKNPIKTKSVHEAMKDFVEAWCLQCPITQLLISSDEIEISFDYDVDNNNKPLALYINRELFQGALCHNSLLDTCPTLIQIQKIQNLQALAAIKEVIDANV